MLIKKHLENTEKEEKIYMFYLEAHDSKATSINVKAYFFPVCFRCMGVLFCFVVLWFGSFRVRGLEIAF